MNIFAPFIGPAKATGVIAIALGLVWIGHRLSAVNCQKERAEVAEATLEKEREIRRAVDVITTNRQKEKSSAKATIDSLRADLRSGAERLSVAVAACPDGGASAGDQQARADILPEVADRIVDLAADADEAVRDLNECVDKYNAVKAKLIGRVGQGADLL